MRLKELEVHGFKTFANRTAFAFGSGITAVVGPNGSGKSNVADSIRWGLGEQSYSVLRTRKTEDVIFGGSSTRPRMGMGEVAITLENPDAAAELLPAESEPNGNNGLEPRRSNIVEDILRARPTEVTILRRAFRSGENEYLINGHRVRLRDVQEVLQRWGLARNTYAVVGQGLIDQALSLRAEERRALFEEAAGIGLYQSKKTNALEKLEETQQNLLRANDIINEIAPRLPSLARQADRAKRYEGVATALGDKLKQWYAYQWARAQEHYARASQGETEARHRVDAQRALMQDLAAGLAEARRQAQILRGRLAEQRRARATREAEFAARERDLAVLEERIRNGKQQQQEAERELARLSGAAESRTEQLRKAIEHKADLEHQRALGLARRRLAESRISELETARAAAPKAFGMGDARELARRLVELQQILPLYEQALRSMASVTARAEALAHHELTRREREQLLERARNEWNDARTAFALVERDIQAAELAIDTARENQKEAATELTARRSRQQSYSTQLENLVRQREQIRSQVENMRDELSSMSDLAFPDETALAASEQKQNQIEEQEGAARSQFSVLEEIHNRALLDAERSRAEIARLESEIEDDLGPVELDTQAPHQLRLRLAFRRQAAVSATDEGESAPEEAEQELVVLPEVPSLPDHFDQEIRRLKNQMKYIGNVNPNAPAEYDELKERHAFLTEQAADLVKAIERLHEAIAELDAMMQERFKQTFDAINVEFKHYFNLLFSGGTARLELTEPDNLIGTGVEIIARPPGKRAAHLATLSGGERSLTACALLFAILKASPTPFCVLDEVDAMLDEANVGRFRDALKDLARDTQFIVITHNRTTIESANTVYGISMGDDGVSQVISMRLADAAQTYAA